MIGPGTPSATACGSRRVLPEARDPGPERVPVRQATVRRAQRGQQPRSSSARGPVSAAGPELIRVSEPTSSWDRVRSRASRATSPP